MITVQESDDGTPPKPKKKKFHVKKKKKKKKKKNSEDLVTLFTEFMADRKAEEKARAERVDEMHRERMDFMNRFVNVIEKNNTK